MDIFPDDSPRKTSSACTCFEFCDASDFTGLLIIQSNFEIVLI